MKEVPKKDQPEVSGGELGEYPQMPWAPIKWPVEDGPTFPEVPTSPCESPTSA